MEGKPSLLDESKRSDNSDILDRRHPQVEVFFIDDGDKRWKNIQSLRMLPTWAMQLPKLAVRATLSDIVPENSLESMKMFDELCRKAGSLWMSIDAKVDDVKQPLRVVLYEEKSHKRVNINALMVWENCAKLVNDTSAFCQRIEYFSGMYVILKRYFHAFLQGVS